MKNWLAPLMAGGLVLGVMAVSSAAPFANFAQMDPAASNFSFTGGNTGVLSTVNDPIFFRFGNGTGFTVNAPTGQDIGANISFSATANGTPTIPGANSQQFRLISFTVITGSDQTVGGKFIPAGSLLLSGTTGAVNPGGILNGSAGSATFFAPAPSPTPNGVVFASDFINFTGATNNGFSLSLSPGFTTTAVGGPNRINPFSAAGAGTFSSIAAPSAVPEPGTIALLSSVTVCGMAFSVRRMRHRK